MRTWAAGLLLAAACSKERVGTVEGPPLTIAPDSGSNANANANANATTTATATATARGNPVSAKIVDVGPGGTSASIRACEELMVAVVKGSLTAGGEQLGAGDVLVAQGAGDVPLRGAGRVVVATVQPPVCDANGVAPMRRVVRAAMAPELTWAGGAMHAHLDVEKDLSPNAYLGRLSGTAPVVEHAHADSWEIVCAIEAAGTFTQDGKEQRLSPGQVVAIPPGAKHAWKPDPGKSLVAIQIYAPPGPEQRFRVLAAPPDAGK